MERWKQMETQQKQQKEELIWFEFWYSSSTPHNSFKPRPISVSFPSSLKLSVIAVMSPPEPGSSFFVSEVFSVPFMVSNSIIPAKNLGEFSTGACDSSPGPARHFLSQPHEILISPPPF